MSCKDYGRRLHIGDIDKFRAEVTSVGASSGIIYSRNGFAPTAVEKARKVGLGCCRLYRNQPADLPELISVPWFACVQQLTIAVLNRTKRNLPATWIDFLTSSMKTEDGVETTVVDEIERLFHDAERLPKLGQLFPTPRSCEFATYPGREDLPRVQMNLHWKHYKARMEAQIVSGSYSFINQKFMGQESSPAIDLQQFPGNGWEEIAAPPDPTPVPCGVFVRQKSHVKSTLMQHFDGKSFEELPK